MSHWKPTRQKERCFNFFLFVTKEDEEFTIVTELGVSEHMLGGDDRLKISFLEEAVESDFRTSNRFKVPERFNVVSPDGMRSGCMTCEFIHQQRTGIAMEWLYQAIKAPQSPLMVITCIVDGRVRIDRTTRFNDVPIGG